MRHIHSFIITYSALFSFSPCGVCCHSVACCCCCSLPAFIFYFIFFPVATHFAFLSFFFKFISFILLLIEKKFIPHQSGARCSTAGATRASPRRTSGPPPWPRPCCCCRPRLRRCCCYCYCYCCCCRGCYCCSCPHQWSPLHLLLILSRRPRQCPAPPPYPRRLLPPCAPPP